VAIEIPGFSVGCCKAKVDLSAQQFHGVYVSATFEVDKVTDGTKAGKACGILQNNPILGEAASFMVNGISKAVAGASVTANDRLKYHTDGTVIPQTSGVYRAIALEGASAAQIFSLLFESGIV